MTISFTLALWCIPLAALLPVVAAGIAKKHGFSKPSNQGGYDNSNPRAWMTRQSDASLRADAAQYNTFEALPLFYTAIVVAHLLQANQFWIDTLAVCWVVLRALYILCYVKDWANTRSTVWFAAFAVSMAILFLGV